ncbi:uncharacterized protein LOC117114466 isoform X2 [Anneissia japonica]|nr:uncharacterized protein LOC117114466 isoform X2 [Anneissia japonica]
MVDPRNWHLNIVCENAEGVFPNQRLWLTITNTTSQKKIVDEKAWQQFEGNMKIISLPAGGGSFCAKLGTSKGINKKINWIHSLDITVPSQPCTCSLESLMVENSTLDAVYHLLCIDMNSSVESVKRIAKQMQRNASEINSLQATTKPFDALILLVSSESDSFNVSHIVMALTCTGNDMTPTEKRVVEYILKWHRNCEMCHHIRVHNTGAQLHTEIIVNETSRVV